MKLDRRYWPWGILLLGCLVFIVLVVTRPKQAPPSVQGRIWQVEALIVHPRSLSPVLTLYGQIQTPALMRAVASERSRVVEVAVREGQRVPRGQRLVRLDPRDFEPKVVKAQAEVDELESQLLLEKKRHSASLEALQHEDQLLQLRQLQVTRLEKLKRRNLGSEAALDQARMDRERQALAVTTRKLEVEQHPARLAQVEARLERARATLAEAELALERSHIEAPFAGIVAQVEVAIGDDVQANQSLVSLYPLNALEVRAKVPAPYLPRILLSLNKGQTLNALGRSLGSQFGLQLTRLAGRAEAGGIDALLSIQPGQEAGLRLGLPVTIQLSLPSREHVVPVPYASLYGSDRVYRIVEGRLEAVRVSLLGNYTREGEEWVLVYSQELADGDLILVTHLPAAAEGLSVQAKGLEAGE